VANPLNLFRQGAVGFIDWLGAVDDMLQSGDEGEQHKSDHRRECKHAHPSGSGRQQREFERDRLRCEKAVNAENTKCDAEQCKEDENEPRTGKIIAVLHANETGLLLTVRGIAHQ